MTTGNNADAYADRAAPDGFGAGNPRATVTAPGAFDRAYDTALDPLASAHQSMASVTQAFYVVNWLHDWWYDSGFDEAAGNAQQDNYGRGGVAGDPLLVEAQDYSGTDNSSMQTPVDGDSPRMQLMLWRGPEPRTLTVTPPGSTLVTVWANFGPATFDVTAALVLANDASGTTSDACETITNDVAGKVVLADGGNCPHKLKGANAEAAGGVGLIVPNTQGNIPAVLVDGAPLGALTSPALGVSQADGVTLKTALAAGAVTAHLARAPAPRRDSSLDGTLVAHEWGHYLHSRLAECGLGQCKAMAEGWGDFVALDLMLREGDDLDGTCAMGAYATRGRSDPYFGIRRAPYSVDPTKNAMAFRHIGVAAPLPTTTPLRDPGYANYEAHNAGEIWGAMLFEVPVALLETTREVGATRTFAEARRAMADYVVAGLKLMPRDATFTEGRDALLAAVAAAHPEDAATLAAAFARRGAGSCAESPARDSTTLAGVVESYDLKARIVIGTPTLDDRVTSCDDDGQLDGGERGRITVPIVNLGGAVGGASTVTVSSPSAGVTFPQGASVTLAPLAPFATATAAIEVALDRSVTAMHRLWFAITAATSGACRALVAADAAFLVNRQEVPNASAVDDVEATDTAWTVAGREASRAVGAIALLVVLALGRRRRATPRRSGPPVR